MPLLRASVPALVAVLATGCGDPADAKATVEAFRRSLADPAQHALRQDDRVDAKAMKEACLEFARKEGKRIAAAMAESLAALPPGRLPAPPERRVLAKLDPQDLGSLPDKAAVWSLHTEADRLVQAAVGTLAPMLMHQSGMMADDLGIWIGFLNLARPTLAAVTHGETKVAIVADYGGLDTLVLDLERSELGWMPAGLAWWRPAK
jgi:hypothetical protein